MNELIKRIFENFTVDNVKIPVVFLRYTGNNETYVTFQSVGSIPSLAGDDNLIAGQIEYDFDVYSKENYLKIVSKIKEIMKENEFMWKEDSPDMYEDDTKYFHKTISFVKEIIL